MATTLPKIVVSRSDHDLLERLVDAGAGGRDVELADRLGSELARAEVVDEVPAGVVSMNAAVEYEDLATGERHEVRLVFPRDADPARGKVSVLAPIGCALLGLAVGQRIEWPLPGGKTRTIRVVAVRRGT